MMKTPVIATAIGVGVLCTTAQAQYTTSSVTPKVPGLTSASTAGGGFLQGADDCNSAHTPAGVGDVSGVPFVNGTTGTTGQTESPCYAFGTTGVDNDVWFDWTATASGNARMQTCGGTTTDTKIAAYPLSVCPAPGTVLACNDDACGLQSSIMWPATPGTSYTLQVGTFPGAAPGAGTFDITTVTPPPCGQYDDGVTENSLGLVAGGEIGWIHAFDCGSAEYTATEASTAYGSAGFPGGVTNGNNSRIAFYHDPDGDANPTTNATLIHSLNTVVVNGSTDILNAISLSGHWRWSTSTTTTTVYVMATADQIAGEFPGPMDQTNPTPAAWVVGSTLGAGTLDLANLNNNNVPPLQMSAIGFPAAWLLRMDAMPGGTGPGTAVCFGDGSGAACGCGNESAPGAGGCLNTVGSAGLLSAGGTPSVTTDTMTLTADGVINQPGLFFQGNNTIGGGTGATFGDGIRCCGQSVVRIQVVNPPGTTSPATAQMTETATTNGPAGTINPGDKKCYQYWYRDPAGGGVCGFAFNLTNAMTITWSP